MVKSAYIHIPFCKSKCNYCAFTSFNTSELPYSYIKSLLNEIAYYYKNESLQTLYFGGGTPSLLPITYVEAILKKFKMESNCEVTFEVNPDDITLEYLKGLKTCGINRISIGSQSFNDKILKLIGRRHDSSAIFKAVELAKNAGFDNISLDLIYGLPTQDLIKLEYDINKILTLDVQHVSTYGLKIEDNSLWGKKWPDQLTLPSNDEQADMYEFINKTLEADKFYRYEISNFAKKGFESKHNLNYWNNSEYYGFGISAHGYTAGKRYSNTLTLEDYLENPIKHIIEHTVTKDEQIQEEIFLGFRKTEGINTEIFKKKFGFDFETEYSNILKKYSPIFIQKTEQGYCFTIKGVLLSNIILSEFI